MYYFVYQHKYIVHNLARPLPDIALTARPGAPVHLDHGRAQVCLDRHFFSICIRKPGHRRLHRGPERAAQGQHPKKAALAPRAPRSLQRIGAGAPVLRFRGSLHRADKTQDLFLRIRRLRLHRRFTGAVHAHLQRYGNADPDVLRQDQGGPCRGLTLS